MKQRDEKLTRRTEFILFYSFVCLGTDSNGLTLIDVINITIPNFVQVANTLAQAPVNFSYADTQAAANLINDMSAFIFAKLPNIANNGFGLGQLIGGLVDGVDAIANGIAAIASTVFGDVWSLFSGAFGLAAGLFAFLPYIFTIVVVGGVALCFFYILKQSGVLDQLKRNNAQSEVTESQVLLQANRSTHPAVGGSAKYR